MQFVIETLEISDVAIINLTRDNDRRGFFCETYSKRAFSEAGINIEFVQDNHAMSAEEGTVRGLHFQIPPFAQDKLIRVVRGTILDVAVDIRYGSPTFGRHVSALISAATWNQILIPAGFAHGLVTLEPCTEVIYKVSEIYSPEHERGILWNDPALKIEWPVRETAAILSEKDKKQPKLSELPEYFFYRRERV